ncbi:hypothetical protein MTO96_039752, partial [Rhipicephalus appendiculatus]
SVLKRSVGADATCLGLMKRDADNVNFFLNSLGQLHSLGVQFDPAPLYPPVHLPVPRGTPNIGHLVSWDHSQQWTVAKWNEFPTLAQDPSRLNPAVSMGELGMDSLMAVEVRQAIERHVSLTLSMKEIRQLTIEGLRQLSESTAANEQA